MTDNVTAPVSGKTFKTKETATNGHMPAHVLFDTAEAEVLGTVTASPAANTVLGRLKDLLSLIVLAAGTNIIGKVTTDITTPGTTNKVATISGQDGVAGGSGVVGATTQRVVLATDVALPAGTNTLGTVSLTDISAGEYETVAASQTDQALGATGGTGDYLAGVLIVPATTSPDAVSIKDGSGSAITIFTGGASSVSNLVPFFVALGIKSTSGAWKVTTGANVSAIGVGNFT